MSVLDGPFVKPMCLSCYDRGWPQPFPVFVANMLHYSHLAIFWFTTLQIKFLIQIHVIFLIPHLVPVPMCNYPIALTWLVTRHVKSLEPV